MLKSFKYLLPDEVPVLLPGHQLVLNTDERIVTLLEAGQVRAQCQLPHSAFRLFFLLLKAPHGADYAEMLACHHCPESVFNELLNASSYTEITEQMALQVGRWDQYLTHIAAKGQPALEKELKLVRRAVKERNGINTILKEKGFALTIKAIYRKGYFLDREESGVRERKHLATLNRA